MLHEIEFKAQTISDDTMKLLLGDDTSLMTRAITLTYEAPVAILTGRRRGLSRAEHARKLRLARHARREIRKGHRRPPVLKTQMHFPSVVIGIDS